LQGKGVLLKKQPKAIDSCPFWLILKPQFFGLGGLTGGFGGFTGGFGGFTGVGS